MKIKSEHIQVYPTSFRDKVGTRNYNPESRLNTEFNLTNRFRFLGNDDYAASGSKSGSFVVSWDSTSKILIFLIHGYYFKATLSANDYSSLFSNPSSGDIIWGQIKILPFTTSEDSNTKYKAYTLVNTDASGSTTAGASLDNIPSGESVAKFEGVALTRGTEPAASSTTYTLALLKYNYAESRWEIPETSKLIIPSTAVKNTDGSPIHRKFTTDELSVAGVTLTTGPSSSVPLKISSGTLVDGNFEATGSSKIGGSEEVTGDLQVWQDLEVDGNSTVTGDSTINGHIDAGSLTVTSQITTGGRIEAGSIKSTGLLTAEDELNVAGVTLKAGQYPEYPLEISDGTLVDGDFDVIGDLTINGSGEVSRDLHVGHDLGVVGDAQIKGKFTTDELSVAGVTFKEGTPETAHLEISDDTYIGGNFRVAGSATIDSSAEVASDLHVGHDLGVVGDAQIKGSVHIDANETVDGHISAEDYIESDKSVEGDKVYAAAKDGLRFNTGGSTSSSGVRHTVYPGALPLPVYTLDDGYRLDRDDSGGSVSPSHAPTPPILLSKFMSDFNLPATDDDEVFILNYICRHILIIAQTGGYYSESSYTVTNTYWFMIEKGGLSVRLKCLSSRNSSESSSSVSTNPVNTTCYKLYWGSTSSTPTIKDQKMQDILNPEEWSTVADVYNKIKAVVISDKLINVATKNIKIEQINDHGYGVSFGNYTKVDYTKDSITHIRTYCVGEHHGANFGFGWYYGGGGNPNHYNYVDHTGKDYSKEESSSIPADCAWKLADIYVVHKQDKEGNIRSFHIYGIAWYEVHMKDADGNDVYILNPVGINVSNSFALVVPGSFRSGFTISGSGESSNIPLKISEQLSDMYIPVVSIQRDPSLAGLSVAVGSSITIPDSDIQISPDQASDKSFKLISLTPELASVSYDWNGSVKRREWKVRGVAAGTAQIQIMSNDNTNATSTINVTVTAS